MSEDRLEGIERIINMRQYLTPVSRDNKDIQSVMDTETVEFQELWNALCDCFNNVYVKYMMQYGLSQWESIYKLHPHADETYADRRKRILAAFAGTRPYTLRKFREMLDTIYGKGTLTPIVDGNKYLFNMQINWDFDSRLDNLHEFVEEIVPKNLLILYTYFFIPWDEVGDIDDDFSLDHVTDESVLDVLSSFKDIVPYGRAKDHLHYDGKWQYLDGLRYRDFQYGDEFQYSHIILPGSVQYEPYIGWQFVFDGVAQYDGTWQYDGSYIYNGERPWVVLYNDFMDELSVLVITMSRPDGSTELQDDIAARLTYGERVPYGARRIGMNLLPIDCGGYLKVTRAHPYGDTWQYGDTGRPKYNGNVQFGDGWQYSKGGVHYGIDTLITAISGDLIVADPKLIEPPYGERFPEIEETVHANDAAEQAVLDLGAFVSEQADRHDLSYGEMRYGNYASVGTNPLPVDNGGELTILKGHTYGDGRRYDYGVSTVYGDGMTYATMQFEGGETYAPRRYSAVL